MDRGLEILPVNEIEYLSHRNFMEQSQVNKQLKLANFCYYKNYTFCYFHQRKKKGLK